VLQIAETTAQALVIVLIITAAYYSYKIAEWSCARSVQWLTTGFIWILVWRIAFTAIDNSNHALQNWIGEHQTFFILPAYAMWAWGMYLLYKTLINLGRKR